MKAHTQEFKEKLIELGREIDSKLSYEQGGETIELGNEELNSITPHYQGALLKSVMKQLDIDSNVDIPIGTEVNYQFGLKLRSGKNLFDKDNSSQILDCLINGTTGAISNYTGCKTLYIACKPNTTYTISRIAGTRFNAGTTTAIPTSGLTCSDLTTNSTGATITLTTNSSANYLCVFYYNSGSDTLTEKQIRDSIQIEIGNQVTPYEKFGAYDYLDYGNYIVFSSEKQEDVNSYKIVAYDKMLYAMKPYEALTDANDEPITYPITLRNYLIALARRLDIPFKNASDTFVNYDKEIKGELYLTEDGKSLDYTYRDVLDELSQATASSICISNDDELEVRYVNETQGKNLFKYPYSDTTKTLNGVTFTDNGDGSITIDGTATAQTIFYLKSTGWSYSEENKMELGTYSFNQISNNPNIFLCLNIYKSDNSNVFYGSNYEDKTFEITTLQSLSKPRIVLNQGAVANNIRVYPQLEKGENTTSWEPYGADCIDEEYLKDVNVNFGEKFGKVNALVLSRSADSDIIDRRDEASIIENGLCEIKISDNQILNDDDRDLFIDGIFDKLKGLEYYVNDYTSTGITYYDFLDRYNVKIEDMFYSCIMLNDEVEISQGINETVYAKAVDQHETDYTKSSKSDKMAIRTEITVDKQKGRIDSIVGSVTNLEDGYSNLDNQVQVLGTRMTQTENNVSIAISKATDVENTIDNGVPKVTTAIVAIDYNGIDVGKSDSKVHTQMKNNEFSVGSTEATSIDDKLAFIGYDEVEKMSKAQVDNMKITHWLSSGAHRREKFEIGVEKRTGEFYEG